MAVTKSLLKITESDCVVKVAGTAGAATITLATDLLRSTEAVSGTPTVVITTLTWTGAAAGVIDISRGGVTVYTLLGSTSGQIDLSGQFCIADSTGSTSDIVVTISGAQAELLIRLAKSAGYTSKIETSQFSVYDNKTVVGS